MTTAEAITILEQAFQQLRRNNLSKNDEESDYEEALYFAIGVLRTQQNTQNGQRTNADLIRSFNDDELTAFLCGASSSEAETMIRAFLNAPCSIWDAHERNKQ